MTYRHIMLTSGSGVRSRHLLCILFDISKERKVSSNVCILNCLERRKPHLGRTWRLSLRYQFCLSESQKPGGNALEDFLLHWMTLTTLAFLCLEPSLAFFLVHSLLFCPWETYAFNFRCISCSISLAPGCLE